MDHSDAWLRKEGGLPVTPSLPASFLPGPAETARIPGRSRRLTGAAPAAPHPAAWSGKRGYNGFGQDGENVFAAIDLGSNNCRLMIAARASSGFRVVESYSRIVRLGEGLQSTGELGADAMERTLDALQNCAVRVGRRSPVGFRAVATEACRRARNGKAFLDRVKTETGLKFEIISGREEAELVVESCASLLFAPSFSTGNGAAKLPERGLLLDIGGASTEIAWVRLDHERRTHEVIGFISLPVGVITLAEQFPQPEQYQAMMVHVREQLEEFESTHRIRREVQGGAVRIVGTSGTVTTLASLDLDLPRYMRSAIDGYNLGVLNAHKAIARLHRMGQRGMHAHPCIGADRAGFVLPGCAIFEAFLSLWPSDIIVADRGLRDGMLRKMIRNSSVTEPHGSRTGFLRRKQFPRNAS